MCYTGEYGHGGGAKVVILSDKMAGPDRIPIPSLLAAGAVHQHLIKTKQRPKAALFVEAGMYVAMITTSVYTHLLVKICYVILYILGIYAL